MNELDKTDPAWIAAREALIATRVDERLQTLKKDTAETVQRETEEFKNARQAKVDSL